MNINSTLTLNNRLEIPLLGLGMYLMSNGEIIRNVINCVLKSGYRHFDTAAFYANEEDIGRAMEEALAECKVRAIGVSNYMKKYIFFVGHSEIWRLEQSRKSRRKMFFSGISEIDKTNFCRALIFCIN